jgi:hypothetical protein
VKVLLLLFIATGLSFSGSSSYTSTDKTNKNKYIYKGNNTKNTVQRIQNTVNTSTHITKTPTHTHPHTSKQVKTTTVQDTQQMK